MLMQEAYLKKQKPEVHSGFLFWQLGGSRLSTKRPARHVAHFLLVD